MKKAFVTIVYLPLCLQLLMAQKLLEKKPVSPIVCYQTGTTDPDYVSPPRQFHQWKSGGSGRLKTANFEVEYINFPSDNKAKTAFQFAIDIWETQISSPVTIRVRAQWGNLASGVLGQAIWGTAFANFDGAQNINTFYPVALAEKISGADLNPTGDPDIVATFNSTTSWYFGTDGAAPAGSMDLVTIVLHEIAHGLGFTDTYDVESATGSVGFQSGSVAVPFVYDLSVENSTSQKLFSQFPSPSSELKSQLTSNDLYFNSPLAIAAVGSKIRLYAPTTFNDGSSIAHLDEFTYSTSGDANKLMTPQIAAAEAIHDPGSILLNIFKEIGWISTRIVHTPLKDSERKDGAPYLVKAVVVSDNGFNPGQVVLNYTTDNVNFATVAMTPTGVVNEFQGALPGKTSDGSYGYYVSVVDALNRKFTKPGKIQTTNKPAEQGLIVFQIGPDTKAPDIAHVPVDYIEKGETSLAISAQVTDNIGVQSVKVEFSINDQAVQTTDMTRSPVEQDRYTVTLSLPSSLVIGDKVRYRLIATDISANSNVSKLPTTDLYSVFVTGIMPTQDFYENNFDVPSNDFVGSSFNISTPADFVNGAIHSEHPYQNGSGPNDESNYTFQLQIPIRISTSNPFMRFDEIVLVEPGEAGSVFGSDSFYDYVIVEGSKDHGVTWKALIDGYDSRANTAWLDRYNSSLSNDNSQSTGIPSLFRERLINLVEKGNFNAGDEVLIRFRLFADQAAHGWGWAVDNVAIQSPVTGLEERGHDEIRIYPNPSTNFVKIELTSDQHNNIPLEILNTLGERIWQGEADAGVQDIDVQTYAAGVYFVRVALPGKTILRKFIRSNN